MQIFVKLQGGRTRTLCFNDSLPVSLLKKHIEDYEGIPCNEQRLACSQRELPDDAVLSGDDLHFVSLSLRVVGGKGGFGSLLRGAPSKIGQKKTDNFDACRDLNGRRLRYANDAKRLQEWIANSKERELEQVALQHIKKTANQHKFDDEKYTKEGDVIKESISSALERGIDQAKKSSVLLTSKKRALEEETTGPLKRHQVWDDLDNIPDEESEPEAKEKKYKKTPEIHPTSPSLSTTTSTTTTTTTTTVTTNTSTAHATYTAQATHEESARTTSTSTSSVSVLPLPSPTTPTTITPTSTNSIASASASAEFQPVDLSKYETAKELEAIGGDALKAELQRLGLLCGGTPADRANRLFLLKTTPIGKLDKKHFAKKK